MEVWLYKDFRGVIHGATEQDVKALEGIKANEVFKAAITKTRNGGHHRKMFALLNMVFENQDRYEIFEDFLTEIKLRAGHYKEHVTMKGKVLYIPKSINFASMDQLEFNQFYEKVTEVCLKHFYDEKMTGEELEGEVNKRLSFCG